MVQFVQALTNLVGPDPVAKDPDDTVAPSFVQRDDDVVFGSLRIAHHS